MAANNMLSQFSTSGFCKYSQFRGGGGGGQWCNRQGGRVPPRLLTGKFLLTYREKRGKEKNGKGVKIEKKRKQL